MDMGKRTWNTASQTRFRGSPASRHSLNILSSLQSSISVPCTDKSRTAPVTKANCMQQMTRSGMYRQGTPAMWHLPGHSTQQLPRTVNVLVQVQERACEPVSAGYQPDVVTAPTQCSLSERNWRGLAQMSIPSKASDPTVSIPP